MPVPARFAATARTLDLLESQHYVSDSSTMATYHTAPAQISTLAQQPKTVAAASVLSTLGAPTTVTTGSSAQKAAALPLSTLTRAAEKHIGFSSLTKAVKEHGSNAVISALAPTAAVAPEQIQAVVMPVQSNMGLPGLSGVTTTSQPFPWLAVMVAIAAIFVFFFFLYIITGRKKAKEART